MNLSISGGTAKFRSLLKEICSETDSVHFYENPDFMSLQSGPDQIYFLLPDYENGKLLVPEMSFDRVSEFLKLQQSGSRFYIENYQAQDYLHSTLSLAHLYSRERYLYQEYIEYGDTILQARDGFYLPSSPRGRNIPAAWVSNCIGTHRIFKPGANKCAVLNHNAAGNVYGAMFDFSRFDPYFRRPYADWKKFWCELLHAVTGISAERIGNAFEKVFPDPIQLSNDNDPVSSVKKALAWHENAGLFRAADGSQGMYEMIRSNDLGVRHNLRTDSELLTGALFVSAGKEWNDSRLTQIGCKLVDFLLDRGIQRPDGLIKWFDQTTEVWSSDAGRDGLALWQMYKITGIERYHESALRLADVFLQWLSPYGLCCGNLPEGASLQSDSYTDNPVYYGEMAAFLFQLNEKKYTDAALRIIERIGEKFPEVAPFGFSNNFTYSRWLLMLSAAQYHTERDFADKIMPTLNFFADLQESSGGLRETPIRLEKHDEAGVGVGNGSDCIADLLYCNNFVLNALSILVRLPEKKQTGLDMKKIRTMYENLKKFWLDIQIRCNDPKLDGGWMRAFDMQYHEYYGLNKDLVWGSYCIMAGWVMGFIPLVMLYDNKPQSMFT